MPDYWIKITEREDEDIRHHHYLIEAKDEKEARRASLRASFSSLASMR